MGGKFMSKIENSKIINYINEVCSLVKNKKVHVLAMDNMEHKQEVDLLELYSNIKNYMDYIIYIDNKYYHKIDILDNKVILSNYNNDKCILEVKSSKKEYYDYILS